MVSSWRKAWYDSYVNVQRAKVLPKLLLPFNPNVFEVLVAEDNNTPLSDKKCELVFLQVVQLGQLEAADLSSNDRGEL